MTQPTIYCECEPVVERQYTADSDCSPTEAIVDAVSTAAGVEATALPPLYDFVDPDALETLLGTYTETTDSEHLIRFTMDTWVVFARSDGRVCVCDRTQVIDPQPVFDGAAV